MGFYILSKFIFKFNDQNIHYKVVLKESIIAFICYGLVYILCTSSTQSLSQGREFDLQH